jgi:hypothetical protein
LTTADEDEHDSRATASAPEAARLEPGTGRHALREAFTEAGRREGREVPAEDGVVHALSLKISTVTAEVLCSPSSRASETRACERISSTHVTRR